MMRMLSHNETTDIVDRPRRRHAGLSRLRALTAPGWIMLMGLLSTLLVTVAAQPAHAAATVTIADWEMNEPPGATVMLDSSGNGINGSIGSAVHTGFVYNGATGYEWLPGSPTAPPPKPERLVQVPDSRLNPGTRDFAVTVRFRTTTSYGNIIQKGQSTTPGGYFKWEIPSGQLMCLYRSRNLAGTITGQNSVKSPDGMKLNDGAWHTVRCEKRYTGVTMTIDGAITIQSSASKINGISNNYPLTIGGKVDCDQVTTTCDYFAGDIDWVHIEASSSSPSETTPPTTPGVPTGEAAGAGKIALNWAASSDASPPITYRVYRDGGSASIGQTTSTTFTDSGLAPGSTHTYTVDATDAVGNVSAKSAPSAPITVSSSSAIFTDDFSSGSFANWTGATRLTIDASRGAVAVPSARGNPSAQSAFAYKNLGTGLNSTCLSVNVNLATQTTTGVDLFRLRTATDGPIAKAFVTTSGLLAIRSDFSGVQQNSTVALGTGWHTVQLCGTVGSSGAWTLSRDGVTVVNAWTANTGSSPIGRIQIGDTAAKTWTANFDDVALT
jgi:hypothetical protein